MYKEKRVKIPNSREIREILIKIHYLWKTNTHRHAHTLWFAFISYIYYHFYLETNCPQVSDQSFIGSVPIIGDLTIPPLLPKTKTFLPKHYSSYHNILYLCSLRINRPIPISVSSDSCRTIIKQLLDDNATVVGRLVFRKKKINPLSDKNNSPKRRELFIAINKNKYLMSAYYDLYETPSPDGKEDK